MSARPITSGPVDWAAVPADVVAARITGRSLTGEQLSVTVFELEPGAVVPRHAHPSEEFGYVVRGALHLSVADGDEQTVTAGGTFFVGPELTHSAVAGPDGCTLLECYSPPRVPKPVEEAT